MSESADLVAARVANAEPEADGVAALAAVEARLSHGGRLDAVRALERQIAWLQARQAALLERLARRAPSTLDGLDKDWVREDVACALRIAPSVAGDRIQFARGLAERGAMRNLMARGETTMGHARVLVEATYGLSDDVAAAVEAEVLPKASAQTVPSFRRSVRRAVLRHSPPRSQEQRHQEALGQRRVAVSWEGETGMGTLWAYLPAEGLARVMAAVDGLATRVAAADERTSDQRRADALVQLAAQVPDSRLAAHQRLRPQVQVTVALSTLTGVDDQPGELAGCGPIPAAVARRIAGDPSGTWRRLVTDDLGRLLDYGPTTYRPPAALADHVMALDRTCVFPGCAVPARRTEIDHRVRWQDGGPTSAENLRCLCRRHHHLKDERGWRSRLLRDGGVEWRSPTGRQYIRPPNRYPIDTTAHGAAVERRDAPVMPVTLDSDPDPPPDHAVA